MCIRASHTPGREEASELAESVAEGEAAASVAVKQGAVSAAPAEGVDAGIADLVEMCIRDRSAAAR